MRRRDYHTALSEWLAQPSVPAVVLCENSNAEVSDLRTICEESGKPSEVLTFYGQDFPHEKGKGYGEMRILRHAYEHSELIRNATRVIKCTGRFSVPNIEAVVNLMPDAEVVCDWRRGLTWVDSRLFCATKRFMLEYFFPLHETLDDSKGVPFEVGLSRATHRAMADGLSWSMFPVAPIISGFAGEGPQFPTSKLSWAKREAFRKAKDFLLSRA